VLSGLAAIHCRQVPSDKVERRTYTRHHETRDDAVKYRLETTRLATSDVDRGQTPEDEAEDEDKNPEDEDEAEDNFFFTLRRYSYSK